MSMGKKPKRNAVELMNTISKKNKSTYVFRKDPMGQAATVLYIACVIDENRMSQKKRVDADGMDPTTIRSRLPMS